MSSGTPFNQNVLTALYAGVFGIKTQRFEGGVPLPTYVGNGVAFPYFGRNANAQPRKGAAYEQTPNSGVGGLAAFDESGTIALNESNGNLQNKLDIFGNPMTLPVTLDGFVLWNEPAISMRRQRDIVESAPVAGQGSSFVLEIVRAKARVIAIQGFIIRLDDEYPADEIATLDRICGKNESVKIESLLTNAVGIKRVVVEDLNFPDLRGAPGVQPYEILLREDRTFEYSVLNK